MFKTGLFQDVRLVNIENNDNFVKKKKKKKGGGGGGGLSQRVFMMEYFFEFNISRIPE